MGRIKTYPSRATRPIPARHRPERRNRHDEDSVDYVKAAHISTKVKDVSDLAWSPDPVRTYIRSSEETNDLATSIEFVVRARIVAPHVSIPLEPV